MSALSEERISFQTGLGQVAGGLTESSGKGTVSDVIHCQQIKCDSAYWRDLAVGSRAQNIKGEIVHYSCRIFAVVLHCDRVCDRMLANVTLDG